MGSTEEGNARRLEKINRSLLIAVAALVITIILLAILDFA